MIVSAMHKAQYCAATARSAVVVPDEKLLVIRNWQQRTFEMNAHEKRIREEKKAWLERKIVVMQAPPPPRMLCYYYLLLTFNSFIHLWLCL
jgi:hypothetical protein